MPQLGLEVTEGTVTELFVTVGQRVSKDDAVVELATDKAQTDVVAPCEGMVAAIDVEVGDTVPVGAVLLHLATRDPGAADLDMPTVDVREPASVVSAEAERPLSADASSPAGANGGRLRAAPVARRAARQLGVDLEAVTGTGPRGRITLDDVRRAAEAGTPVPSVASEAPPTVAGDHAVVPLSPLRRVVARRMTASQLVPQFHLSREVDASHLLGHGTNVNDLLIQAVAETVVRHRALAAAYMDEGPALRHRSDVNVGLAVATRGGLVVPIVRGADRLTLPEIATQRARLVAAARAGRLSLQDMSEGTITVSNLGGGGVDAFAAMVNPGEAAILALGRVVDRLVPRDRGIAVQPTLTLTMTFDHRVVDGTVGAACLAELASLVEGGMAWRT